MSDPKSEYKVFWTVKELAEAANVSGAYVRQQLLAGRLRGSKAGFTWIISNSEARRWLDERARQ